MKRTAVLKPEMGEPSILYGDILRIGPTRLPEATELAFQATKLPTHSQRRNHEPGDKGQGQDHQQCRDREDDGRQGDKLEKDVGHKPSISEGGDSLACYAVAKRKPGGWGAAPTETSPLKNHL